MREYSSIPARRRFMTAAGALCANTAAQTAGATAHGALATCAGTPSPQLGASKFRACIGTPFQVQALGRDVDAVSLSLSRVTASPFNKFAAASSTLDERAFSIVLAGTQGSLKQDTYAVTHPILGEFLALLVPSADGCSLTGVFSLA